MRGLQRAHNLFTPRDVSGYYVVIGLLPAIEEALPRLRTLIDCLEATPTALHAWLTETMIAVTFRPDDGDASGMPKSEVECRRPSTFNHHTDAYTAVYVVYSAAHDSEVWWRDVHTRDVIGAAGDVPPNDLTSLRGGYLPDNSVDRIRALDDAGLPMDFIARIAASRSYARFDITAPAARATAEQTLDQRTCAACRKPAFLMCGQCKFARYCSVECQRADWLASHKSGCAMWRVTKLVLLEAASGE